MCLIFIYLYYAKSASGILNVVPIYAALYIGAKNWALGQKVIEISYRIQLYSLRKWIGIGLLFLFQALIIFSPLHEIEEDKNKKNFFLRLLFGCSPPLKKIR